MTFRQSGKGISRSHETENELDFHSEKAIFYTSCSVSPQSVVAGAGNSISKRS